MTGHVFADPWDPGVTGYCGMYEHGLMLAPRMWPDPDRRCAGCGHRYDPYWTAQTRELPPVPYWLTEHVNRIRARRWGRGRQRDVAARPIP